MSKFNIPPRKGVVIWFTGMSGAGKSTLSNAVGELIGKVGKPYKILDGDEVRENLTADLGFSKEDRSENIRRISYVAKTIADCCGVAIVAAISPYIEDREKAKDLVGSENFFEVFVDCDLDTLIERDVKGLYKKAIAGEIKNFTGISDPYEAPVVPMCVVDSGTMSIEESVEKIKKDLNDFVKPEEGLMFYI